MIWLYNEICVDYDVSFSILFFQIILVILSWKIEAVAKNTRNTIRCQEVSLRGVPRSNGVSLFKNRRDPKVNMEELKCYIGILILSVFNQYNFRYD